MDNNAHNLNRMLRWIKAHGGRRRQYLLSLNKMLVGNCCIQWSLSLTVINRKLLASLVDCCWLHCVVVDFLVEISEVTNGEQLPEIVQESQKWFRRKTFFIYSIWMSPSVEFWDDLEISKVFQKLSKEIWNSKFVQKQNFKFQNFSKFTILLNIFW